MPSRTAAGRCRKPVRNPACDWMRASWAMRSAVSRGVRMSVNTTTSNDSAAAVGTGLSETRVPRRPAAPVGRAADKSGDAVQIGLRAETALDEFRPEAGLQAVLLPVGVELVNGRHHLLGRAVQRRLAERGAERLGQDRDRATGDGLGDRAPEGLDPLGVMKVDEEIDAAQELGRFDGAELECVPVGRPSADQNSSCGRRCRADARRSRGRRDTRSAAPRASPATCAIRGDCGGRSPDARRRDAIGPTAIPRRRICSASPRRAAEREAWPGADWRGRRARSAPTAVRRPPMVSQTPWTAAGSYQGAPRASSAG